MKKLNFGCGSIQPKDWTNVDHDLEFVKDPKREVPLWTTTKTFHDDEFDIIVAHAVVQQFEWHEMVDELKELRRILKPGGLLRISLPDILEGFEAYKRDDIAWFPNGEEKIDDRFAAWLTWYSTSKTLLTEHALINKLFEAGFLHIIPSSFGESTVPEAAELDTRENEFFFLEVTK